MTAVRRSSWCALVGMLATSLAGVVTAAPRESVEQLLLERTPQRILVAEDTAESITRVVVAFPGGDGHLGLSDRASPPTAGNGYTASLRRDLVRPGTALVLVDAPAQQPRMSLEYRESPEYRRLLTKLFEALRSRFADARFYIVGYSNGAVSALVTGGEPGVAGVILISNVFRRYSDLATFGVKVPILVIHHEADRCIPPEFDESFRLMLRPTMVRAIAQPYGPSPCGELSAHQLHGQESAVAEVIRGWLATGRAPARIR